MIKVLDVLECQKYLSEVKMNVPFSFIDAVCTKLISKAMIELWYKCLEKMICLISLPHIFSMHKCDSQQILFSFIPARAYLIHCPVTN